MPTHEEDDAFWSDWKHLTPEQQKYFKAKVVDFTRKLQQGIIIPSELGLKKYRRIDGMWEFRFGGDGRALMRFGSQVQPGEMHIIWLRIGTHSIYDNPEKK